MILNKDNVFSLLCHKYSFVMSWWLGYVWGIMSELLMNIPKLFSDNDLRKWGYCLQQYLNWSYVTSNPGSPLPTYMAMTGKCESSCDMLPFFMAVFFFTMFFTFVISMPALSVPSLKAWYHWYLIIDITDISSQILLVSHHRYHWDIIKVIRNHHIYLVSSLIFIKILPALWLMAWCH